MVNHAAHAVAHCTAPGVHEKQRFSFAHQNAPGSGDADKQPSRRALVRPWVTIADDGNVVDEQGGGRGLRV